ncbi:hypothetical protein K431DRAFT_303027 [Polychaeton citri CBS 116435]|uniref:Uncharacterized protein n=1 Tax=Polychaeton citri CBS 116435 TaxID=1314669 RepID=A0A9P4Q9J4_9PEZI|nr:hypothetical protein K431DRAFT_303027 [Polychaeton citri CBS 116435]
MQLLNNRLQALCMGEREVDPPGHLMDTGTGPRDGPVEGGSLGSTLADWDGIGYAETEREREKAGRIGTVLPCSPHMDDQDGSGRRTKLHEHKYAGWIRDEPGNQTGGGSGSDGGSDGGCGGGGGGGGGGGDGGPPGGGGGGGGSSVVVVVVVVVVSIPRQAEGGRKRDPEGPRGTQKEGLLRLGGTAVINQTKGGAAVDV